MSHLYQQYRALELDGSWIGLEVGNADPWFCTPIGAEIIGWDGAIHYCFVPGFAETVFCVNPENYGGHLVYPCLLYTSETSTSFLVVSSSVLPSPARWSTSQRSCCWMSRWALWT